MTFVQNINFLLLTLTPNNLHELTYKFLGSSSIYARNITIDGEVERNMFASGKVFISSEGRMKGDIQAPKVSIMDGAQFKGSVKMKEAAN